MFSLLYSAFRDDLGEFYNKLFVILVIAYVLVESKQLKNKAVCFVGLLSIILGHLGRRFAVEVKVFFSKLKKEVLEIFLTAKTLFAFKYLMRL